MRHEYLTIYGQTDDTLDFVCSPERIKTDVYYSKCNDCALMYLPAEPLLSIDWSPVDATLHSLASTKCVSSPFTHTYDVLNDYLGTQSL